MSDYPSYFAGLYEESGGRGFGLTLAGFAAILLEVSGRYGPEDVAAFHRGLRLEDLALARACAEGNEAAWECFLNRYR